MSVILCACGTPVHVSSVQVCESTRCPSCGREDKHDESHRFDDLGLQVTDALEYIRKRRLVADDTVVVDVPAQSETSEVSTGGMAERKDGDIDKGRRFAQYEIREKIGAGGMGVVYAAYDGSLDREVALKILGRDLGTRRDFIERFKREARAAAQLSHPNITHIYSIGEEAGFHFFAMELVRGKTLVEVVRKRGPLHYLEVLDMITGVAEGLQDASAHGIVHRDIKPANLLQRPDGRVKITDFGLAKAFMDNANVTMTNTGVIMGTPLYMSPEQARGEVCDLRSDIYSLGATMYYLLHGRPPFKCSHAIAVIVAHLTKEVSFPAAGERGYPDTICKVVGRMMAKDRAERYQSYDHLLSDLRRVREGRELEEAESRQVFTLKLPPQGTSDTMRMSKLRVAKSNFKMGRHEKAVHLLEEVSHEKGDLGVRATFLLIKHHLKRGATDIAAKLLEKVRRRSEHDSDYVYATWQLFQIEEKRAVAQARRSLDLLASILDRAEASGLPREVGERAAEAVEANLSARQETSELVRLLYARGS